MDCEQQIITLLKSGESVLTDFFNRNFTMPRVEVSTHDEVDTDLFSSFAIFTNAGYLVNPLNSISGRGEIYTFPIIQASRRWTHVLWCRELHQLEVYDSSTITIPIASYPELLKQDMIFTINYKFLPIQSFKIILTELARRNLKIDTTLYNYIEPALEEYSQYRRIQIKGDVGRKLSKRELCTFSEFGYPLNFNF